MNAIVKDDPRAWIPGLSDEAGAGSWLAAALKQFAQPSADEVAKMEQFANQTLRGSIQNSDGKYRHPCIFCDLSADLYSRYRNGEEGEKDDKNVCRVMTDQRA